MIKHVKWRWGIYRGIVAITHMEGEEFHKWPIVLERLRGNCPEARYLKSLLEAALPPGWERIRPPYPYRVDIRRGMSGCRDYRIRVLEDSRTLKVSVAATIHISMYGALNEGVTAPVWAVNAVLESGLWPTGPQPEEIRVIGPRWQPDDFIWPAEREEEELRLLLEAPAG